MSKALEIKQAAGATCDTCTDQIMHRFRDDLSDSQIEEIANAVQETVVNELDDKLTENHE